MPRSTRERSREHHRREDDGRASIAAGWGHLPLAGDSDRGAERARSRTEVPAVLTVDYDRLDLWPGMTVLDLGCGEGRHAFEAYRRGARVVAVDWGVSEVETTKRWLGAIAEAGAAPAGARYEVVRADLLALPFPDGSVDRVIASEVLEHIPDDATAMAEIARVLKPGGTVAVTVPRYGPERV